jgi:hypothetical protein
MKLTGPACTKALNGDEEAGRRERTGDNAGGVRVERRVRPGLVPVGTEQLSLSAKGDFISASLHFEQRPDIRRDPGKSGHWNPSMG